MSNGIRSIQLSDLEILKCLINIFSQYELDYYMLGGTLLGAVRHKGFIPWDDDIDIGMPRPDYERFLKIAEQELKPPLYLYSFQNKRRISGVYFAQIANESVSFKRSYGGKVVESPAWIDIFPLDGVPEGKFSFWRWKNKCMLLSKMFSLSQIDKLYDIHGSKKQWKTKKDKFIRVFLILRINKLLNGNRLWNSLDKNLKKNEYETSTRLINFCGFWRMRELFNKSVYGEGSMYPFEDIELRGPVNYDFVLTQMYGDYMTPPPDSEKNHHNTIIE